MSPRGIEIIEWEALSSAQRESALKRPAAMDAGMQSSVASIIRQVREEGDAALARLTLQFDGVSPEVFEPGAEVLNSARLSIDPVLANAIGHAGDRIRAFHAADVPRQKTVETAPGLNCTVTYNALPTVGIYIPGGRAPLVSTVLMLAIPAKLAGCRQIVMCSPPGQNGGISAEILAAASICGIDRVFCVGGAQAIAAMAYGTGRVPRCHKIFGPGNSWVTAAKQQVSQDPDGAAIDMPAGPSEVMVIADARASDEMNIEFIAWDLLSQAEHGPDSQVLLVTDSRELAAAVIARMELLASESGRSAILEKSLASARIIRVASLEQAMDIANGYAPEHLILNTENARQLAGQVENAGSVFVGRWTPESLGDYCSGTNHVLPTNGFARAYGALGVGDFMRRMTLQEASAEALMQVGPTAEVLAGVEGLDAHRMAVRSRLASLGSDSPEQRVADRPPVDKQRQAETGRRGAASLAVSGTEAALRNVLSLARPEIVAMKPYSSARSEAPALGILLNANEAPWPLLTNLTDLQALNRYPDPQPGQLVQSLAKLYELPTDHLLVTRGSDEGIDLLTRVFCRAGKDAILHFPPTFGMYRIAAETQGATVVAVPRQPNDGFSIDVKRALDALHRDSRIRLIFLTSPNNPTGDCVDRDFLEALLEASGGKAIVVVDEAYAEFCQRPSAIELVTQYPQLVVLRTLSKAWAAAGLRCGSVLAQPHVIDLLRRIIAPYPLASPVTALALRMLQPDMQLQQNAMLDKIRQNKKILLSLLARQRFVLAVWPGEANFVLVRVTDAPALLAHCASHGVILRGYTSDPLLLDCLRISVGSKQDLAALEHAFNQWEEGQS